MDTAGQAATAGDDGAGHQCRNQSEDRSSVRYGTRKAGTYLGGPSFREIPRHTTGDDIDVNHLHINTTYIQQDINVVLPLARMAEFEQEEIIGRLAPTAYAFYGFQWQSMAFQETAIAPIARKLRLEGVETVLLTPA